MRIADATHSSVDRARVCGELLANPDRPRVLQVRASGLDDVIELSPFGSERITQRLECAQQPVELRQRRQANVRRDRVVGALRHVHVIVRMHGGVRPPLPAEQLIGAVREHFVHVHVVRGPRAGLVRIDDELIRVLASKHFIRCLYDGIGETCVETTGLLVRERSGLLDPHLRDDERPLWTQAADGEVFAGAQRLNAVQRVGGDLFRAEGVLFGAESVSHGGESRGW